MGECGPPVYQITRIYMYLTENGGGDVDACERTACVHQCTRYGLNVDGSGAPLQIITYSTIARESYRGDSPQKFKNSDVIITSIATIGMTIIDLIIP